MLGRQRAACGCLFQNGRRTFWRCAYFGALLRRALRRPHARRGPYLSWPSSCRIAEPRQRRPWRQGPAVFSPPLGSWTRQWQRQRRPSRSAGPGGSGGGLSGGGRIGGVPPAGERRFVPDEVVVEFHPRVSPQTIARFARIFNLTQLELHSFALLGGATFYRWRITPGSSVPSMVARLQNQVIVANAQPNYLYTVQDDAQPTLPPQATKRRYALRTLQIKQAQQIATGKDVTVAVIDSEVEASHPDLAGSIKKSSTGWVAPAARSRTEPRWRARSRRTVSSLALRPALPLLPPAPSMICGARPRARHLPSTEACNGRPTAVRASWTWLVVPFDPDRAGCWRQRRARRSC